MVILYGCWYYGFSQSEHLLLTWDVLYAKVGCQRGNTDFDAVRRGSAPRLHDKSTALKSIVFSHSQDLT
jgi:hypothetical protein